MSLLLQAASVVDDMLGIWGEFEQQKGAQRPKPENPRAVSVERTASLAKSNESFDMKQFSWFVGSASL
ncbi:MAG: hypothetical protein D6835_02195 [Candidatus Thermofonsia bacterium]|nr:MAG: hypothetical protein D6835_02195 [Candidatus Thermofonsia bacterium]